MYILLEVNFTTPPENTTVFRGSDVTISCGHVIIPARPVIWIINGTSFDQEEIHNSPLYQQNNSTTPIANSLTVFSINGTTTFQCVVQSTPNKTTSTRGTVTVTGLYIPVCIHSYIHTYIYNYMYVRTYMGKYALDYA